jgi:hypothetical protein
MQAFARMTNVISVTSASVVVNTLNDRCSRVRATIETDSLFANDLFCETITHAIHFGGGPALWLRVGHNG